MNGDPKLPSYKGRLDLLQGWEQSFPWFDMLEINAKLPHDGAKLLIAVIKQQAFSSSNLCIP
jgi:hypothetical protein